MDEWLLFWRDRLIVARHEYLFSVGQMAQRVLTQPRVEPRVEWR
jgi:hypothetical protein